MTKCFWILYFWTSSAFALEGLGELEKKILEKNQEYLSLQSQIQSKDALNGANHSNYYPTLYAVGGLGQIRTDEIGTIEKGTVGYLEGRFNIFKGFRDQSLGNQREIDFKIAKLDLEIKKRDLRLQITSLSSELIYLHKLQEILSEEEKTSQTQKKMAAKKVSAGLTGSVDNLEFELRQSELQIENSQIAQKHQEAHQKLISFYGEEVLDSDLEKLQFSQPADLVKLADQKKVEDSLEFQRANLLLARSESEKNEIRADFLPSIDFTYSVGRLTPSELTPIRFNESKYALLLTIPLFSGFDTYYKTKSANLQMSAAERLKTQKRSNIMSQFNILKLRISQLGNLFEINEKKLVDSQKYFDLTLSEYRRGIKNSPDLVSATERFYAAKKRKFEILKELEISKVEIENLF